jgi:hypothetical protein
MILDTNVCKSQENFLIRNKKKSNLNVICKMKLFERNQTFAIQFSYKMIEIFVANLQTYKKCTKYV